MKLTNIISLSTIGILIVGILIGIGCLTGKTTDFLAFALADLKNEQLFSGFLVVMLVVGAIGSRLLNIFTPLYFILFGSLFLAMMCLKFVILPELIQKSTLEAKLHYSTSETESFLLKFNKYYEAQQ